MSNILWHQLRICLVLTGLLLCLAAPFSFAAGTASGTDGSPGTASGTRIGATDGYRSARAALLSGHYDQYAQLLEKAGTAGDMKSEDEFAGLCNDGRIVAQDHQKALEIWQRLSSQDYAPAIYHLGGMYDDGIAVAKDSAKALELFTRSSTLGCGQGTIGMAYMYREGHGVKRDYARALALCEEACARGSPEGWYGKSKLLWLGYGVKEDPLQSMTLLERSAQAGLPYAQYLIACRYHAGEKIPVNDQLARVWAQKGTDQADLDCQLLLGRLKMDGQGGAKDCVGGIRLIKEVADQSVPEGATQLGHAYRVGDCVAKDLVAAQDWFEKAIAADYAPAENELAVMYFSGEGVPKNLVKSFDLNMKAAKQDCAPAQYNVGMAYENGYGVKQDLNEARIWYAKAVVGGNPHACNNLSLIYLRGLGCAKDENLAMSLRKQGVRNGCPMACYNLGRDYATGSNGMPKNMAEAVRLYKKSVQLVNDQRANNELGYIYENGLAGKKDLQLAIGYYREASKGGNQFAAQRLKALKVPVDKNN